ncbi:MAG: hypothetical protein JWR26_772 [Pedosphaera sp.]|nr:hypothetical protein [Pedosphaera sp.]
MRTDGESHGWEAVLSGYRFFEKVASDASGESDRSSYACRDVFCLGARRRAGGAGVFGPTDGK